MVSRWLQFVGGRRSHFLSKGVLNQFCTRYGWMYCLWLLLSSLKSRMFSLIHNQFSPCCHILHKPNRLLHIWDITNMLTIQILIRFIFIFLFIVYQFQNEENICTWNDRQYSKSSFRNISALSVMLYWANFKEKSRQNRYTYSSKVHLIFFFNYYFWQTVQFSQSVCMRDKDIQHSRSSWQFNMVVASALYLLKNILNGVHVFLGIWRFADYKMSCWLKTISHCQYFI